MAADTDIRKLLNEYLFYEFGLDDDEAAESRISDRWPFTLKDAGTIEMDGAVKNVFTFADGSETYYAVAGRSLSYLPVEGVDLPSLKLQFMGSNWIGKRDPVDLNTSCGAHPAVPLVPERRKRFLALAAALRPQETATILEGLFLKASVEHLALVRYGEEALAYTVGDQISPQSVEFPQLSPWRRLSIAIGQMLASNKSMAAGQKV